MSSDELKKEMKSKINPKQLRVGIKNGSRLKDRHLFDRQVTRLTTTRPTNYNEKGFHVMI
jgi:hypothetical protein